jgi:hypothetical protein
MEAFTGARVIDVLDRARKSASNPPKFHLKSWSGMGYAGARTAGRGGWR